MSKDLTSTELNNLVEALSSEIVYANIHFRLYKDITGSVEFENELNQSKAFWGLTIQAHLDVAVFRLCKIYDKQPKSLNLEKLLKTIGENLHLFAVASFKERQGNHPLIDSLSELERVPDPTQLQIDLEYVSNENTLVKKLQYWRNNYIAHISETISRQSIDIASGNPLTVDEISELIEKSSEIFNRYSSLFNATSHSTLIVGHDDFKWVLKSVRAHKELLEEQFRKEYQKIKTETETI